MSDHHLTLIDYEILEFVVQASRVIQYPPQAVGYKPRERLLIEGYEVEL